MLGVEKTFQHDAGKYKAPDQDPLPSQALVAHTCNPSYSRGRNQKYCLKPTWANSSSARPYLKKTLSQK
jgi:hypothetical protein